MKIALEIQPCCGQRSGIGLYTYELAKRLKSEGDLEFQGNLFNFLGRHDNSKTLAGISMPVAVETFLPYGVYRRVWNKIPLPYFALFPQADLTCFFNYIVPPGVCGKVINTICDMTYQRFPETMNANNFRRIQQGIQYSVKRSDRIITISEFSKQEIVTLLGVPEEKVSIVSCAPSLTEKSTNFSLLMERYGLRDPYLLYVGTIEPRKNLKRLLKAFTLLKQRNHIPHQLVLAGGKGWKSKQIYELAKELPVNEDVVFTGYISPDEKNALYQKAAAFVFPSLYEGFGMPPLEAMTFNCPVVCANSASLPEVVGDAAELVEAESVESIAAGLHRVIFDNAYADELRQRGRERIKQFNWDASAKKLIQICQEVLEEK